MGNMLRAGYKGKHLLGLIIIILAMALCLAAEADSSGTCGENLTWTLNDSGLLTISGTGRMSFTYIYAPWPGEKITNVVIEDGVTNIADYAFSRCELNDIYIPDSISIIGEEAFIWCENLTSITLPNSLTDIGDSAFFGCNC